MSGSSPPVAVIPVKAGIQLLLDGAENWIPACAGMTKLKPVN
jgi:hypothetical protein